MKNKDDLLNEINKLLKNFYYNNKQKFVPGNIKIPLSDKKFGYEEVSESIESLISGNVTMGEKVKKFEELFADYIGVKHSVMVNSGSSANLLALELLPILPGSEIITPLLTFSTTVAPIIKKGFIPVFADVEVGKYIIAIDQSGNTSKTARVTVTPWAL